MILRGGQCRCCPSGAPTVAAEAHKSKHHLPLCWMLRHPHGLLHHPCSGHKLLQRQALVSLLHFSIAACRVRPGHLMPAALGPQLPAVQAPAQQPVLGLFKSHERMIPGSRKQPSVCNRKSKAELLTVYEAPCRILHEAFV